MTDNDIREDSTVTNTEKDTNKDDAKASKQANTSKYHRDSRYRAIARSRRGTKVNKTLGVLCTVFVAIIIVSIISIVVTMNSNHISEASTVSQGHETQSFTPSESDIDKLAEQGYDAAELTDETSAFVNKFFNLTESSVKDGSWKESYSSMVNEDMAKELKTENLLLTRNSDRWLQMFDNHPYFAEEVESCDSISWDITYYNEEALPYCDATITVVRPELEFYTINSCVLRFSKFQDTYRITYDADGKVIKVKKMSETLLEGDVNPSDTLLDESAAAAYAEQLVKSGSAINSEKSKKNEEALAKAEEAKNKAEEEAKKAQEALQAEKDKQKNENTSSSSNSGNSNSNTGNNGGGSNANTGGGNTNTGDGNSDDSGNTNAGGNESGGSSSGTSGENSGGSAAAQAAE